MCVDSRILEQQRWITRDNRCLRWIMMYRIPRSRWEDSDDLSRCCRLEAHSIRPKNLKKYKSIEQFAKTHGVDFYPAGRGIGHQVMVEEGSFLVFEPLHSRPPNPLPSQDTPSPAPSPSPPTPTPTCTAASPPSAHPSFAQTPQPSGPPAGHGGRFLPSPLSNLPEL